MEMEEALNLAQADTRFLKVRKNLLYTFGATRLPYVCLSETPGEVKRVTVRVGEVTADKPQIAVPNEMFSFEGFEQLFGEEETPGIAVLLARQISMPPSKYVNKAEAERKEIGPLIEVAERTMNRLDNENDVRTAVISAPDQVWGLSILLYVGSQVARSASSNVQEHFEHLRLRGN